MFFCFPLYLEFRVILAFIEQAVVFVFIQIISCQSNELLQLHQFKEGAHGHCFNIDKKQFIITASMRTKKARLRSGYDF